MKKELFAILVVAIAFGSCKVLGTLNSLSEDQSQFVFRKELIGSWTDPTNTKEWYRVDTISGSLGKLYTIELVSRNSEEINKIDTLYFLGRLVELGDWQYLDCKLDYDNMFALSKSLADLTLAKHFIIRTSFHGSDHIELAAPDPDELMNLLKAGKVKLHYLEVKKDDYLILNTTAELQKATEALIKYPQVYKNKTELVRSR